MVRLTSITTKAGDAGQTGLGDGSRVPKYHPRIEALGTVDELNAVLGMVLTNSLPEAHASGLRQIQNDLFDLGADLCFPAESDGSPRPALLRQPHVQRLDDWLEQLHPLLPALESFILPGGGVVSASLHWARTICRRAERQVLALQATETVPALLVVYLNRLSDLLFQLARINEDAHQPAPLWKPSLAPPVNDP